MAERVPTLQDVALTLQSLTMRTEDYQGDGLDLGAGFAPGGLGLPMAAVVRVSALDRTTGNETYEFKLEESADGSTWTSAGAGRFATATGVLGATGWIRQRYVRLALNVDGTTPSITFEAFLNPLP